MEQFAGIIEYIKIIGPLITGGLAGSILTYIFNQRIARRRIPRLDISVDKINYALGRNDDAFDNVKLSYKGTDHENLLFYQMEIKNISSKTVSKAPLLLLLSKDCAVVEQSCVTHPTNRQIALHKDPNTQNAYVWDAGELKPTDSAEIRLLLSPSAEVTWSWRGEDDVEITSRGQEGTLAAEREIKTIVFWVALFIAFGSLPVFGGVLQSVLLAFSAPSVVSIFQRFRYYLRHRDDKISIVTGSNSSFLMATGGSKIAPDGSVSNPRSR